MTFPKYLSYLGAISCALSLEMVTLASPISLLRENPIEISLRFPMGRDIGAPRRTGGAGQRGPVPCLKDNMPITAVTPINNGVKTLLPNPTLYVYVPETRASSAEFTVVDGEGEEVYNTKLALTDTPGIVSVSLPDTVALTPGQEYTWIFAVVCNPANRERDEFVRGLILPTSLDLLNQEMRQETGGGLTSKQMEVLNPDKFRKNLALLKTNPNEAKRLLEEQVEEYSKVGVWSETMMVFTKLSQAFPNDCNLMQEQKELLKSVELGVIAETFDAGRCQRSLVDN
ncbi:MAG TPA: hypothetical protein DEG17_06045 [Cyanobacteria bacterium UBA11149]|nr:hypothetical protein [Cyanobacteria bacterium UBA11367]HBE58395.1 hypothetical protein [Cyanobacteria bacterium UBA11366]HBK63621.1 hypothetical protein [Cyanobacteria bacterium UBA11166]HBR73117.1 hypothetical protein [Cyanobacteria bacterium UBA11159]HBS68027.1 hypothetical protein [Cyanobacteria bacterium UBA11153]HBW88438.1 hypothetical protein [Cyanobacteria bacterium UBA11149]HCA93452.1 hypothetical protein [Cyanobacteria bacterium UBA9226]